SGDIFGGLRIDTSTLHEGCKKDRGSCKRQETKGLTGLTNSKNMVPQHRCDIFGGLRIDTSTLHEGCKKDRGSCKRQETKGLTGLTNSKNMVPQHRCDIFGGLRIDTSTLHEGKGQVVEEVGTDDRSHTTTRHKGKEIAKPITPSSETASEEDRDPEEAQKDKDMQKNLVLIEKYFKKIYKPTNNNLRTSSNSKNKNVDTTLWYKNDNQSGQFGNQRMVNVDGARKNVGSPLVQQSGIQFFNCKEFRHFAKECQKAEKGYGLCYDWLADTDEEVDEQEMEAHYSYIAKIQEVSTADSDTDFEQVEQVQNDARYNVFANELQHSEQSESVSNTCLVETDDSNVIPYSPDMCEDDIQNDQNDVESDDVRVALANLIETSKSLGESISVWESCLVALQTKKAEFEKYKEFNDRTIDYDKLKCSLNETLGQLALKDIEIIEGLKTKAYEFRWSKKNMMS
nr:hypothetical protein [Tanacetum cinerariifolium]